ncbi:hypothetical protein JOB18_000783 [Solea senegalensis]|uniref:Uncharacterized protein n=1 Tax=Solea senegalensis TaxID=28829 RepID=A0AAV6QCC3_SOLSE|nr:hypothetical protein JOB18_000783 [Solea senegalensis]
MPKPISVGELSSAHIDPKPTSAAIIEFSGAQKKKKNQAGTEFTLCRGWSILLSLQLSVLVDLSSPAVGTTRLLLSKPSDVSHSRDYREPPCPSVNVSLQPSFGRGACVAC